MKQQIEISRFGGVGRTLGIRHVGDYVRMCLRIVVPDRPLVIAAVGLAFISGLLQIALMFLLATLLVNLSGAAEPRDAPLPTWIASQGSAHLLLATSLILSLVIIVTIPLARWQALITSRVTARMRRALADNFLNATTAYRGSLREGHLQQLLGEFSQNLSAVILQFCSFLTGSATLVMLIAMPMVINPTAGAIVLPLAGAGLLAIGPLAGFLRRDAAKRATVNRELANLTAQLSRLAEEIEAYAVGNGASLPIKEQISLSEALVRRSFFYENLVPALYQLGLLALLLLSIALTMLFQSTLKSEVAVASLLTVRILTYGRQVLQSVQQGTSLAPVVELLEHELRKLEANRKSQSGDRSVRFDGLSLSGVRFAYTDARPALDDLTLHIDAGRAFAIIGPSGEGKTTFCALLMGLLNPDKGTISTGGLSIGEIAPDHWASIAAYVPQDPKIIRGTIADNIRFFRDGFSDRDVEEAARQAHIHDEITMFSKGYRTAVGPGERALSGGQQQRIAIARALLGKPDLLILDEPSSALDATSEALIVTMLRGIKGKTTIVYVTHRAAALEACDVVLELRDGGLTPRTGTLPGRS